MNQVKLITFLSSFLLIGLLSFSAHTQNYPDTLNVAVTYFDFHSDGSCPDFNPVDDKDLATKNMVEDELDSDGLPVRGSKTYYSHYLSKWYRPFSEHTEKYNRPKYYKMQNGGLQSNDIVSYDTSYINLKFEDSLTFEHIGNGVYEFEDTAFFPLDDKGFGKEEGTLNWVGVPLDPVLHNYSFTMMIERVFLYKPDLKFTFMGDDDVWVFINGHLVLDIGGIHMHIEDSFELDDFATQLNLQEGDSCTLSFFFAERQSTSSYIKITSNIIMYLPDNLDIIVEPNDTIQVGDSVLAWTQIKADTGIVNDPPGELTWKWVDLNNYNDDSTFTDLGDTVKFKPTEAYTTVVIWGKYDDDVNDIHLSDSVHIYVLPGDPDHLVIEDTPEFKENSIHDDEPLDSVFIYENEQYNEEYYAILRDLYGNWIGPAVNSIDTVAWSSDDESIVTAQMGSSLKDAQGRANRATMAVVAATDVNGEYDFKGKKLTDDIVVKIMGKTFKIYTATYLDTINEGTNKRADGYIDAVYVTVDDSLIKEMEDNEKLILDELKKSITLPSWRYFKSGSTTLKRVDDGFIIFVEQDKSKFTSPNTSVDNDKDILKIADTEFSQIGFLGKTDVTIDDGMGAVITKAVFDPEYEKGNDTIQSLRVTFSEKVKKPNISQPFKFSYKTASGGMGYYSMTLDINNLLSGGNGSATMEFEVEEIIDKTYPEDKKDSIWIKESSGGNIDDLNGVSQKKETVHVPLTVLPYHNDFTIDVLGPFIPDQTIDKDIIDLFDLSDGQTGTIILVEITGPIINPGDWRALLSIFDAVGNTVLDNSEGKLKTITIEGVTKNYFVFTWAGKNDANRDVGAGSYLGVVNVYKKNDLAQQYRRLIAVMGK